MSRYNSSIHFCPAFVLSQIAKLTLNIAHMPINIVINSIWLMLLKECAIDCLSTFDQILC